MSNRRMDQPEVHTGTMKVARQYGPEDLRVEQIPIPSIGPQDALLRIEAAGICHPDPGKYRRGEPRMKVPGFEYAGTIVEVGDQVRDFEEDDRVIGGYKSTCGKCPDCLRGHPQICPAPMEFGVHLDGSFAQYMRVPLPERVLAKLPVEISFDEGVLMGITLGTAMWAVYRAGIQAGDTVAVFGLGAVGVSALIGARLSGATRVVGLDPIPYRREIAERFGATAVFDPTVPEAIQEVSRLNDGLGVDHAMSAAPTPASVQLSLKVVRPGGRVTVIGGAGPTQINVTDLINREIELIGAIMNPSADHAVRMVALVHSGRIDRELYSSLITHRFPLEDTARALEVYEQRLDQAMKVVIRPWMG